MLLGGFETIVMTHPNNTILSAFGSPESETSLEVTYPSTILAEACLIAEF
jgi:hypothetical protein